MKEKWNTDASDVPEARSLTESEQKSSPAFPLSLDAQKRLLELIYNRESGIISRQELIDVIYNTKEDSHPSRGLRSRT